MEVTYDRMYTVTSWLKLTVTREDDGVPVVCIVDHPAVKDFQAQKYLEVLCEYSEMLCKEKRWAVFQSVKNVNWFNRGNIVDTFCWIPSLPQKLEVRDSFDRIKVLSFVFVLGISQAFPSSVRADIL